MSIFRGNRNWENNDHDSEFEEDLLQRMSLKSKKSSEGNATKVLKSESSVDENECLLE